MKGQNQITHKLAQLEDVVDKLLDVLVKQQELNREMCNLNNKMSDRIDLLEVQILEAEGGGNAKIN
jgi:hypothetical protein